MNARDAIISIMAASPQFADLDPMVLRTIAARCRPKVFLTGQMVFMEGGPVSEPLHSRIGASEILSHECRWARTDRCRSGNRCDAAFELLTNVGDWHHKLKRAVGPVGTARCHYLVRL